MLQAFKTKDPNGNGKADEVPLSGAIQDYGTRPIPFLMDGFIYDDDRTYLILNNGKVDTVANKPEWKEGLTYIKSLYRCRLDRSGRLHPERRSLQEDRRQRRCRTPRCAARACTRRSSSPRATRRPYGADYDAIPPLQGPACGLLHLHLPNTVPGATFVLTNKASKEAQIAAIKLVDYMFTQDGQLPRPLRRRGQRLAKAAGRRCGQQ